MVYDRGRLLAAGVVLILAASFLSYAHAAEATRPAQQDTVAFGEGQREPAARLLASNSAGMAGLLSSMLAEDPAVTDNAREVAEKLAVLATETAKDSVGKLYKVDWYYDTRGEEDIGFLMIPLVPEHGVYNLQRIRGNRRFRKVLEELNTLPRAEASALLSKGLHEALERYRGLYGAAWERVVKTVEALPDGEHRDTLGPSMRINDGSEKNPPTLVGTQLQVLALTLVAASLGLIEARPQVEEVVREALRQRDETYHIYETREELKNDALVMFIRAGIYDRPILSSAVVALTPTYDGVRDEYTVTTAEDMSTLNRADFEALLTWWGDAGRPKHEVAWTVEELAPYDAAAIGRNRGRVPVDWSQGVGSTVKYLPYSMDDETFDSVLRHAGWSTE